MTGRRYRWSVLAVAGALLVLIVPVTTSGLGIGIQTGMPIGGFLSIRDWITPVLGLEAITYVSSSNGQLEGQVTGRLLAWGNRWQSGDLYVAGGVTYGFPEGNAALSAVAGVEFGLPISSSITWNLEAGISYRYEQGFSMAMSTGVHFYFSRP